MPAQVLALAPMKEEWMNSLRALLEPTSIAVVVLSCLSAALIVVTLGGF